MARQRMRVCIGFKDDGTRIIKQLSASNEIELGDRIVYALLNSERRSEFLQSILSEQNGPKFRDYAENWYATYKAPRIKPTTAGGYRTMLESHFYPAWGNTSIDQIDTKSIQEFLNSKKHMAAKSLSEMLILLKAIFESARKDQLIKENPADDRRIQIPSQKKTSREALPVDQIRDVIQSLHKLEAQDRRLMALLLFTGMRKGEVLGLKWSDIDLEQHLIHVRRGVTYPRGQNQPHIDVPKTEKGIRDIPIASLLLDFLQPLEQDGYVIGGENPITHTVYTRSYQRIRRTIDLHGATAHVFRHSIATILYDTGASTKTIQEIVGHADYSTTVNRYVHSRDERKHEAIRNLSEFLIRSV